MDDRVIPDVMNDVFLPQGRYPENFVPIPLLEGGSRKGILVGHWGFLTKDRVDRVIPDIMNHVFLPQGRYPDNFLLISQLEVCQEGGFMKGGTWRTFRVSDWKHGGIGHS